MSRKNNQRKFIGSAELRAMLQGATDPVKEFLIENRDLIIGLTVEEFEATLKTLSSGGGFAARLELAVEMDPAEFLAWQRRTTEGLSRAAARRVRLWNLITNLSNAMAAALLGVARVVLMG